MPDKQPDTHKHNHLHAFKVDWYVTKGGCATPMGSFTRNPTLGEDVATGKTDPSAAMHNTPTTIEDGVSLPPVDKNPLPNAGAVIQQSGKPTVIHDDTYKDIVDYMGLKKHCTQIVAAYSETQAVEMVALAYPKAYEIEAKALMVIR